MVHRTGIALFIFYKMLLLQLSLNMWLIPLNLNIQRVMGEMLRLCLVKCHPHLLQQLSKCFANLLIT